MKQEMSQSTSEPTPLSTAGRVLDVVDTVGESIRLPGEYLVDSAVSSLLEVLTNL